jgi:hypothetical protein
MLTVQALYPTELTAHAGMLPNSNKFANIRHHPFESIAPCTVHCGAQGGARKTFSS